MRRYTHLSILTLCVTLVFGCGRIAEEAAEKAIEISASANGENVDIEIDSETGKVTIQTDEGEVSMNADAEEGTFEVKSDSGGFSVNAGESAELPEDFPADIPVYPGFDVNVVMDVMDVGYSVSGTVPASLEEVRAFYDSKATELGWSETTSMSEANTMSMIEFEQGERKLRITAIKDDGETMLTVVAPFK